VASAGSYVSMITAQPIEEKLMVTCLIRYIINENQIAAFEEFARQWIRLVNRSGGTHHGYLLPHEGASNVAFALFSFESLARYDEYRSRFGTDPEFVAANRIRTRAGASSATSARS
jgi:hypothetical protein